MTPEPSIDVEAFKTFEREGYSRVAHSYDKATAMVTSQVNDAVLDAVGAGPGTGLSEPPRRRPLSLNVRGIGGHVYDDRHRIRLS